MGKVLKVFVVLVILGVAIFFIVGHFVEQKKDAPGALVSEAIGARTIRTTISATGSLEPVDRVEVGTQVSGDIAKIFVDYNSKVKRGQVLAELDKSKLQAALTQADISYKSAVNDYNYKESVFERTKKLAENGSASAVDLEAAEYNMNAAKLAMERSKNEVDQAKLNLSYATIKSPIHGVVLERSVDVGQTVAASMSAPTLFVLARDLTQMKVMADVDEADIGQVKAGQAVEFTVDAFLDEQFSGMVQEVRLNPVVTSNVVTYTVVITAENPDLKLLPGMTATCTIVTHEVKDAVALPVKALAFMPAEGTLNISYAVPPKREGFVDAPNGAPGRFPKAGKGPKFAWVYANGAAKQVKVKLGISDGVYTQVEHGLNVGDSVVVSQESGEQNNLQGGPSSPFMPGPPGKKKK